MVGDGYSNTQRRAPEFYNAPTQPAPLDCRRLAPAAIRVAARRPRRGLRRPRRSRSAPAPSPQRRRHRAGAARSAARSAPIRLDMPQAEDFGKAFARREHRGHPRPRPRRGGDRFRQRRLRAVRAGAVGPHRPRRHALAARRDLARPVRSLPRDRPAAQVREPARSTTRSSSAGRRRNGSRCPSWSPRRRARSGRAARASKARSAGSARDYLDADGVAKLASLALQMPLPWVFDWGALQTIDAEAAGRSRELFRSWMPQDLDMRWLSGERLFAVLQEAAPTGVRDADPAYWQLRLDALRMTQPPRPVRRGGDRLLRHLRGLAAVVGGGALRRPHHRLEPGHDAAAAVGRQRRLDQLPGIAAHRRAADGRGRHGRALGPADRRHRADAEEDGQRARHRQDRQRLVRAPDPGRLHRRRRPAQLGAGAPQREPHGQLRRRAPDGRAVLRRDGHQRARERQGPDRSEPVGRPAGPPP